MQADRVGHACDRSVRAGLRYALSTGAIVDREVRDTADNALTQQFGVVVHSIALIPCFSCRMHDRKDPGNGDGVLGVERQHDEIAKA